MLNGEPYRGGAGWGGELSHVVVDPAGATCACGKRGCLETVASASGLVARYADLGGTATTAHEVADAAAAGDPAAAAVWSRAVQALGTVVAAAVEMLNPTLVVVGGGVAQSQLPLVEPLDEYLREHVRFVQPTPAVVPARLGRLAGVHGAALIGLAELQATGNRGRRLAASPARTA